MRGFFKPHAARGRRRQGGQALIEYLLMTAMLIFLSIGLFRLLQTELKKYFIKAGHAILTAYY